jgi:hypothetical protein
MQFSRRFKSYGESPEGYCLNGSKTRAEGLELQPQVFGKVKKYMDLDRINLALDGI